MSLPNYLLNIKSSGIYRFTWDKSIVPAVEAPTLRLVVGYSEKGPFNTPVYIDKPSDFTDIFGKVSKRLERKGVFFHRMALQALTAGPILALNLKPFNIAFPETAAAPTTPTTGDPKTTKPAPKVVKAGSSDEAVKYIAVNPSDLSLDSYTDLNKSIFVNKLYDTDRFWKLDADQLPSKIGENYKDRYMIVSATDTKDTSCTIFIRRIKPVEFNVSVESWYNSVLKEELPDYLVDKKTSNISDYFAEIYVFRGNLTANVPDSLTKYISEKGKVSIDYKDAFTKPADALAAMAEDDNSGFIGKYSGCILPYFKDALGNYISLDIKFNQDFSKHKMIMKLNEVALDSNPNAIVMNDNTFNEYNIKTGETTYKAISGSYIEGYDYQAIKKTDSADKILSASLGLLNTDKGIREALTNNVDVQYHYLIDTFASTIASGDKELTNKCKVQLAAIAKAKDNALAILNFPSLYDFMKDDKFKTDGKFDITKLPNNFAIPDEVNGASYCAFYTPVVLSDGTVKTVCPSAALVSNNFMEKYKSRQPYYIVAGTNYGRLSARDLVGPDYNYDRKDLDVLEPMGVNAIIYVPRKGTFINSNQTAKQTPVSALSKVHVRELVIYLQDEIEAMLQNYQWELNTQTLRGTIKAKADTILENVKNNNGIYAYANQCDEFNNTQEVIDNEMIILDTAIEPARGAGKMIQQITIHKTGALSSMTK